MAESEHLLAAHGGGGADAGEGDVAVGDGSTDVAAGRDVAGVHVAAGGFADPHRSHALQLESVHDLVEPLRSHPGDGERQLEL
jgi:hypothetical protein